MHRIKIFGAGSIGNHLAHAARTLGWEVVVCDTDPAALERMRTEIYPTRYGSWDDAIQQFENRDAPTGDFDLIFVGTPPDVHMAVALSAVKENPRAVLIEKPLCTPDLKGAQELYEISQRGDIAFFVGYDHVVGRATEIVEKHLARGTVGALQTIDVEFREHWGGIFAAHPWLAGPHDSYLGFSERGGGATGEHSHAINLWQHLAHVAGAGRVEQVSAAMQHIRRDNVAYDELSALTLRTEGGLLGRVVQDVITRPHRKRAIVQGSEGTLYWVCGHSAEGDAVIIARPGAEDEIVTVPKRRPDDFIRELRHIEQRLNGLDQPSGIDLSRGLDTMLVVAAAFLSDRTGAAVQLPSEAVYTLDALQVGGRETAISHAQ